ncbi:I12R1 protein, partial [Halcyon senegalensis]|nr:I12R1 protein [Halcyon senegalensis]
YAPPKPCQRFSVGTRVNVTLNHQHVYIFTNTTAWVEAHWGDHIHRTPNLTLYLKEAVKLDPPHLGTPFTKTSGQLRLQVPRPPCHRRGRPPQREARFRRTDDHSWTQVTMLFAGTRGDKRDAQWLACTLGQDGTFEVQLRHKLPHWSSYWSNWSSSIFVPEEILESPALSYQLGKLGRDGQRVLRLSWQRAPEEQGNVTYTLHALMPACRCAEEEEEAMVLGREVTMHNLTLSGAEYEILLTAANAAGPGPPWRLHVPAAPRADLSFKDISVASGTVMAQWEAPNPGSIYCFEQQLPPGALKRSICTRRDFLAKSIHVERGTLEAPACYRLAVHGWAPAQGWSTFALQHYYSGNASLAMPVLINASAGDATTVVLQWSPSPRAACPGVLAKYLICHVAEGDNVTYAEVDAAASHYTLQNLRPGTVYRVGVWEVTVESNGTCGTWWHFQTKALGPQGAVWKSNLKYLGISLGLPIIATIYQLSKKRARCLLLSPLPKPTGTKATQFSASEMSQGQRRPGFLEPSERFSPAELLIPEPNPSKEMTDTGSWPSTPQPGPVAKEPVVLCPPGCEKELPFTYRRQEVLSPEGLSPPGSTGCISHPPSEEEEEEEEEEGWRGLRQPLVPIALLISDKPVIIRDEEGWDPSPEQSVL